MEETRNRIETVVGNATEIRWSQAVYERGKQEEGGSLFVIVEISGAELLDLPMYGVDLIEKVKKGYYEGGEFNLEGLRRVVESVLVEQEEDLDVSVLAGVILEDVLYLVGRGRVKAVLLRGDEVDKVFEGDVRLSSVSGFLKEEDLLIIGTGEFVELIERFKVGELKENGRPAEVLAPHVHSEDDSSGMAGVVIEWNLKEKKEKDEEKKRKISRGKSVLDKIKKRVGKGEIGVRKRDRSGWSVKVGLIVLALLFLSVGFGVWKRKEVVQAREFRRLEEQVEQRVEEAGSVVGLNPQRSRYLVDESRQEIELYINEKAKGEYKKKAERLKSFLEEREEEIFKRQEIEIKDFVSFSVLKERGDFRGFSMDDKGDVLLYEEREGVVWGLSLEDKSSFTLGSGFEGGEDVAYQRENVYVLRDDGVWEVSVDGGEFERVIEKDEMWKGPAYLGMYAGNVYVLDKEAGEVWKYPVLEEGWGARRRWFGKGIVLDLSGLEGFFVDGDIWFLTESGKLQRFSRGVPQDFNLEGLPAFEEKGLFKNPKDLYVGEESVYVLESGAGRVVVLDKEGEGFLRQYVSEELKDGLEMVVYKGKCYVSTGKRILVFELE